MDRIPETAATIPCELIMLPTEPRYTDDHLRQ